MFINSATSGLSGLLPGVTRADLQLAISGTSGAYFQSLPENIRIQAIDTIVRAMQKVFIPVYVGAAVCLLVSVCFTVSLRLPKTPLIDASSNAQFNSNEKCLKMP